MLNRQPARSRPVDRVVSQAVLGDVLVYIRDQLTADLTLAHLAARGSHSPSNVARQVKQATGRSLHRYVLLARIARAKSLLRTSDRPLRDIATAVGFADLRYFTWQFTRLIGMPPLVFRQHQAARRGLRAQTAPPYVPQPRVLTHRRRTCYRRTHTQE